MYPSARDHIVLAGWPSIHEGLDALGLDAVELEFDRHCAVRQLDSPERVRLDTVEGVKAFRMQLDTHKVRIPALLMSNNFANEDFDVEVNWTIAAIRAADALGIPAVRIDAMMHGEEEASPEENIRVFAEAMHRVLDATCDSNVDLGIENHGYQGNRPEFLEAVFAAVGSPRLGLTIDTGNFYWYGWPLSRVYEIIEQFAPRCKHTHAKNISYPVEMREIQREVGLEYGKHVTTMPEGDVDHGRVVEILRAAGYDRDLCIEDESLGKFPREEWPAVLKADADYFRSIL
jgi:sugar phosphate isomerase/epimerase